jgi:Enoyl-CoA hydratase/carnithine racemase
MNKVSKILIKEESGNGILRLTINNLDQKNALSESMIQILTDELEAAASNQSIRVIVLAANGNVFCSGHD